MFDLSTDFFQSPKQCGVDPPSHVTLWTRVIVPGGQLVNDWGTQLPMTFVILEAGLVLR